MIKNTVQKVSQRIENTIQRISQRIENIQSRHFKWLEIILTLAADQPQRKPSSCAKISPKPSIIPLTKGRNKLMAQDQKILLTVRGLSVFVKPNEANEDSIELNEVLLKDFSVGWMVLLVSAEAFATASGAMVVGASARTSMASDILNDSS